MIVNLHIILIYIKTIYRKIIYAVKDHFVEIYYRDI